MVTLVAKSHDRHVELALRTTLEENLAMVRDTVSHLRAEGQPVFLDAEHFFDGYRANPDYALEVLRTAAEAGAEVVALCDTNGGMLPDWVSDVVHDVLATTGARVGIHCPRRHRLRGRQHPRRGRRRRHPRAGLHQRLRRAHRQRRPVLGRRQPGAQAGPAGAARRACCARRPGSRTPSPRSPTSRPPRASRTSAPRPSPTRPACTLSAIKVDPDLYQHIDPDGVGNDMRMLVSDMAGRASIELKGRELGFDLVGDRELVTRVTDRVKELEQRGYTFEAADASFELLLARRSRAARPSYFDVESWRVIVETAPAGGRGQRGHGQAARRGRALRRHRRGQRPGQRARQALRTAIGQAFPELAKFELIDYKVRILDQGHGTDAITRVLIETTDGESSWVTVGVGHNVIEASWGALVDGLTFGLRRTTLGGDLSAPTTRRTRSSQPASMRSRDAVVAPCCSRTTTSSGREQGDREQREVAAARRSSESR